MTLWHAAAPDRHAHGAAAPLACARMRPTDRRGSVDASDLIKGRERLLEVQQEVAPCAVAACAHIHSAPAARRLHTGAWSGWAHNPASRPFSPRHQRA